MGFDPEIFFAKQKPLAVLTNTLNKNLLQQGSEVYRDKRFRKHLMVKESTLERFEQHD